MIGDNCRSYYSEGGKNLFDLINTYVCRSFRSTTRHGERHFISFIDVFSRYGFVYLIKHKFETFEVFKTFQNEVESQLDKSITVLRSGTCGYYLSYEFYNHLRNNGIV